MVGSITPYFLRVAMVAWCLCSMPAALQAQQPRPDEQPMMGMLAHVVQHDPRLMAERQLLRAAEQRVEQAVAAFRPQLVANGDLGRQRESINDENFNYGNAENGQLIGIQPLFNGFGSQARWQGSQARLQAAHFRYIQVEQQVLFSAISAWLDVCATSLLEKLSLQQWQRMQQMDDATRKRLDAGDGTSTEVAQTESRLAAAQGQYADARAGHETAVAAFRRATGQEPQQESFPPFPVALPASLELAEQQVEKHPELLQLGQEEQAAQSDVEAARSSLWPTLSLRGEIGTSRAPEVGLNRLRNDSITLNLSMPLYQGGADSARIKEAESLRRKLRYDEMDGKAAALLRLRESWVQYRAAGEVIQSAYLSHQAARKALHGMQIEYREGMRTLLDVLNTESEMFNAQVRQVQLERSARQQAYRVIAAMGLLTAEGLQLPVPEESLPAPQSPLWQQVLGFGE